ncbi:hypothetical protein GOODEAATRI_021304, partial [Goodea atripinnis]
HPNWASSPVTKMAAKIESPDFCSDTKERFLRLTERLSSLELPPDSLQSRSSCSLSSGELWKSDWDPEEDEEKDPSSLSSRMDAGRPIWRFLEAATLVFLMEANILRL